jgi:hypothetical protein
MTLRTMTEPMVEIASAVEAEERCDASEWNETSGIRAC